MNQETDFIIEHDLAVPDPFDRAVAHLEMRSVSNSLSDGMDLSVTATLGAEYVEIPLSDGSSLELKCEVHEAIVVPRFLNCTVDLYSISPTRGFVVERDIVQTVLKAGAREARGGAHLNANAENGIIGGQIGADLDTRSSSSTKMENVVRATATANQVEYGSDQIRISANPDGSPLSGKLVDGQVCWKLLPQDKSKAFGAIAELQVRRSWMQLSRPRHSGPVGRLSALLKTVFRPGSDDEFHRQAFRLLTEHLVAIRLQTKTSNTNAVLAAQAVIASPLTHGEQQEAAYVPKLDRKLELPAADLETALTGSPHEVSVVLHKHKVDHALINRLLRSTEKAPKFGLLLGLDDTERAAVTSAAKKTIIEVSQFYEMENPGKSLGGRALRLKAAARSPSQPDISTRELCNLVLETNKFLRGSGRQKQSRSDSLMVVNEACTIFNLIASLVYKEMGTLVQAVPSKKSTVHEVDNSECVTLIIILVLGMYATTFDQIVNVMLSADNSGAKLSFTGIRTGSSYRGSSTQFSDLKLVDLKWIWTDAPIGPIIIVGQDDAEVFIHLNLDFIMTYPAE